MNSRYWCPLEGPSQSLSPPYQTCHRRYQEWVDEGKLDEVLSFLTSSLKEIGKIDVTKCFIDEKPELLIGDKAYDSAPLDEQMAIGHQVEIIAPHRNGRKKPRTQDGRKLKRYKKRWKVERLFAWIQNFRRCVVRWKYYAKNFLGFLKLACIIPFQV